MSFGNKFKLLACLLGFRTFLDIHEDFGERFFGVVKHSFQDGLRVGNWKTLQEKKKSRSKVSSRKTGVDSKKQSTLTLKGTLEEPSPPSSLPLSSLVYKAEPLELSS